PELPHRRRLHLLEKDAAPRAWSWCSCERNTGATEAGSTPADSSRSASSRGPSPASTRMRTPSDSTSVELPELPDPRRRNLIVIEQGGAAPHPLNPRSLRGRQSRSARRLLRMIAEG